MKALTLLVKNHNVQRLQVTISMTGQKSGRKKSDKNDLKKKYKLKKSISLSYICPKITKQAFLQCKICLHHLKASFSIESIYSV